MHRKKRDSTKDKQPPFAESLSTLSRLAETLELIRELIIWFA